MPISLDFPEITDAFLQFLLMPVRQIAHSFEALALWLERRVKLADALEQSTRSYPVIGFEGDAVMMSLDQLQAGALASSGKPDLLAEHVARAGRDFMRGISEIPTAIRQEQILPDTLTAVADALSEIQRSVDRFAGPRAGMPSLLFGHSGLQAEDPLRRRASDLWGEAALAWRVVAGSTEQLKAFVGHIGAAMQLLLPARAQTVAPTVSGTGSMESYSRMILAALILLPQLPAFANSLWNSLVVVVKSRILNAFAQIEVTINRFRRNVVSFFFVDLPSILRKVLSYSMAAQTVLLANLQFFGDFTLQYGALLISELKIWFDAVADYLNKQIDHVNTVLSAINAVLQFRIDPFIAAALGPLLGKLVPPITVDDLITFGTDLARATARTALSTFFSAVNLALKTAVLLPRGIRRRLEALPELFRNALRPPRSLPAETGRSNGQRAMAFPNCTRPSSGQA